MSKKHEKGGRVSWLDDSDNPQIDEYAMKLGSFLDAMADGRIERHEVKEAEERVVALLKSIEPKLDDELHGEVTRLLCEMTAYNIMNTIHELTAAAKPKTKFRG